jgi:putative transposase
MNHSTNNLKHTVWECKYHVVFIPKYRKKVIYGGLRSELGPIFRDLAQQKEAVVVEGHLMSDHVHMLLSIPPKYSVSGVVGFIKGKSAIAIARRYMGRAKNFVGQHFWARGTMCRRWGGTRPRCVSISRRKRKRINGWIS